MSENKITQEQVDELYAKSNFYISACFGKTLVICCQLPNGFVITVDASCVDIDSYNEEIGREICEKRIKDKIWELEGYALQSKLAQSKLAQSK